jgi:hypothetical protein
VAFFEPGFALLLPLGAAAGTSTADIAGAPGATLAAAGAVAVGVGASAAFDGCASVTGSAALVGSGLGGAGFSQADSDRPASTAITPSRARQGAATEFERGARRIMRGTLPQKKSGVPERSFE